MSNPHGSEPIRATIERILSHVGEGIVALDRELRYVFVNDAAVRLVGIPREAVLGRTPWELFPPAVVEQTLPKIRAALQSGEPIHYEAYYPAGDRWYENRLYPGPDGVAILFTDVTARKVSEASLRSSEEAQRLLVSLTDAIRGQPDAEAVMWEVVRRVGSHFHVGRCTYGEIDAAQAHVTVVRDYTDGIASVAGRHRLDDFGPALIADLKRGSTAVVPDVRLDPRTADAGSVAAFAAIETRSLLCVPLIRAGRFAALFVLHHPEPRAWRPDEIVLMEQIADRTWFAVDSARASASLRESRDVLSLAMRGGRMGAWSRNLVTGEVWWSRELEELFGLPPDGFVGTESGFFAFVHDDDRAAVADAVSRAIASASDYSVEFRFRHAGGSWRWMEGRGRAVQGPDGNPAWLYGLGIDITERREHEDALAAARHAAESANRAKDEFLAMLGHELRNPLSPILTALQLMKLRGGPELARERTVIERQVSHLTRLVDDLLDVSRITRGKIELKTEPIEAAEVVARAIEIASPLLEERRQILTVDVPRAGLMLDADAARLGQVVSNLLTNAAKYTPHGGRVWVAAAREDEEIVLRVRDDGIGIAAEVLPQVFDVFVQGRQALDRAQGGLGLGLTIVKTLVERHGGTVRAFSDGPDRGSEFVVRLPRARYEVAAAAAPPEPAAPRPASASRVLVVDDNADAAEMVAEALRYRGFDASIAHDGPEALRLAAAFRPDAAFLDIGLPVMDGYELAARLRQLPGLGRLRLIAVTGYGQPADRQRSLDAGFDHHVVKPVDLDALVTLVSEPAS